VCEDCERRQQKNELPFFLAARFFWWQVICGMEAFSADWNSAAEQNERPKGDRFFALLFICRLVLV
ncbi:hypothetical protein, partial [Flavobacterium psychrophilum]|uniref:hypothetical protein n=1 Tax=Flavobacterium psychrophilum TaxID=96345 RepID=UPI001A992B02